MCPRNLPLEWGITRLSEINEAASCDWGGDADSETRCACVWGRRSPRGAHRERSGRVMDRSPQTLGAGNRVASVLHHTATPPFTRSTTDNRHPGSCRNRAPSSQLKTLLKQFCGGKTLQEPSSSASRGRSSVRRNDNCDEGDGADWIQKQAPTRSSSLFSPTSSSPRSCSARTIDMCKRRRRIRGG